jgi:cobalt-zinc-cadmium efflux system outer membrane protein
VQKVKLLSGVLVLSAVALGTTVAPAEPHRAGSPSNGAVAPEAGSVLRELIETARQNAPEVSVAKAQLDASRSALVNGRLAPFGNPYLEVTAERGDKNVTRDVAINGTLWLPLELAGQRQSRGREARDFVFLHGALVEQARARAAARMVRAYGATVVATERASVLRELLTSAQTEAELVAERVKNGDAIARDASLAAVEAARHEVLLAENDAELVRARAELCELLGRELPSALERVPPPALARPDAPGVRLDQTPRSRSLAAEARFFAASAERLRREGQSPLSVGLVAGRGDLGETRLGGGVAYAFPVFRANRPERARAAAEGTRALTEKNVHEAQASRRLNTLRTQQAQLTRAVALLTTTALPAAELAVSAVQETYAAGKAEMLAVLLSRRELSSLSLQRLELLFQSWLLVGEYVEITGELP